MRLLHPLKYLFSSTASFRRQLLLMLSVGMLTLALGTSIATSWLTSQQMRARLLQHGMQITEDLARESVLALLYNTGENAREPAEHILAFPDVRYVGIDDNKNTPLYEKGINFRAQEAKDRLWENKSAVLEMETDNEWYFVAPVMSGKVSDSPFANTSAMEVLGHVHVVVSKDTLKNIRATIFIQNISLALLLTGILLLILKFLITRLTNPLQELSRVMEEAELGASWVNASVRGPQEIMLMAHAFNKMMAVVDERDQSLRQQKDNLESQVALRTRELVLARDEALAASRHKSAFLANMSHELRTPLNAIIGYTDMLIEDMEDEGAASKVADLKRVRTSALHLLSMINSVLDLAKIEAGHMGLLVESVKLKHLLAEVADMLKPLMLQKNNSFSMEIIDSGDDLFIDAGKLRQILVNLISNANKFTKDGNIYLKAKRDERNLMISVSDTGIGIPHDKQAYIFEEFRQVDMSATRTYGGTGLGLTISQRFCTLMNGTIEVSSEPEKGSCFTVNVPIPAQESKERTRQPLAT